MIARHNPNNFGPRPPVVTIDCQTFFRRFSIDQIQAAFGKDGEELMDQGRRMFIPSDHEVQLTEYGWDKIRGLKE